ncbi:MAG: hypothetical protein PUB17_08565 [Lachnospiraceae bacterium]|nr:hypothetical protein [Lachnospiraceae bacterium]
MIIKEYSGIFFCLADENRNIIYNKISKSGSISLYPDIFFKHPFEEGELNAPDIYDTAAELLRSHGSAHCVFLSLTDRNALCDIAKSIASLFERAVHSLSVDDDAAKAINTLCNDLELSATMSASLKQIFTYYAACGNDVMELINDTYQAFRLPVGSKKEGKAIYAGLYQHIMD